MAVVTRIPIPTERQERTGQAGHRNAQIQNGNLRQRLFLAWTRRLQAVCAAQNQTGFWQDKIERNRTRDTRIYNDLINAGWQVIVIWQCKLTKQKLETTMQQVAVTLNHNLLKILK